MARTTPGASADSFATFGELLRHLRRRAGLTQQQFGQAVGYSEPHVARLEGGQRLPDVGAVRTAFVEALGLQREPELVARLVGLAEATRRPAQSERPQPGPGRARPRTCRPPSPASSAASGS